MSCLLFTFLTSKKFVLFTKSEKNKNIVHCKEVIRNIQLPEREGLKKKRESNLNCRLVFRNEVVVLKSKCKGLKNNSKKKEVGVVWGKKKERKKKKEKKRET